MKDGKYYSQTEHRHLYLYHNGTGTECHICGKWCNDPNCFVYEDDEQGLEWCVGNECIKKFKLVRV